MRNNSIDITKGLGIYLMVLCHTGMSNVLTVWIYSFHMPLFFIVSGYLSANYPPPQLSQVQGETDTFRDKISKIAISVVNKSRKLLIPYFLFALVFCFGKNAYKDWVYIIYGSRNTLEMASSLTPYWFLPCFFLSSVFYYMITIFFTKKVTTFASLLIGLFGLFVSKHIPSIGLPFSMDVAMVGIGLMGLGALLFNIEKKAALKFIFLAGVIASVLCFYNRPPSLDIQCPHVEMSISSYGNPLLFIFISVSITATLLYMSAKVSKKIKMNIIAYFGRNSLTILLIHPFFVTITYGFFKVLNFDNTNLITSIIFSIPVMILSAIFAEFSNKYVPNIIGKK